MGDITIGSKENRITRYSPQARRYALESKARNTRRAYRSAWGDFVRWAEVNHRPTLPADVVTVIDYLVHLADSGQKLSTINVKRAAIANAHDVAGLPDPTRHKDVSLVVQGISRAIGQPPARKDAIGLDDLRAMIASLDTSTHAGLRDRALLLLGFAGGFRRSELAGLDVTDLRLNGKIMVSLARSKTDQVGQGKVKHILPLADKSMCPVFAMLEYLDKAGIKSGPVFRRLNRGGDISQDRLTPQSINLVIKRAAKAARLDWRNLGGHSLRAGFVTSAKQNRADNSDIMAQTGHESFDSLRQYIRDAGLGAGRAMLAAFGEAEG